MSIKPLILDGAMGTNLLQKGFRPPFEDLNITQPEVIKKLHLDYLQAGSEVLLTHTFNAQTQPQCEAAWNIIKDLPSHKFVSIGPEANASLILDFFKDKETRFVFETIFDLKTAVKIIDLYHHLDPIFSFCLRPHDFEKVINHLSQYSISVVGLNCLDGFNEAEDLLKMIPPHYQIYFKPNTGKEKLSPEEFSRLGKELISQYPISYFGGCCGTTPAHIQKVRRTF